MKIENNVKALRLSRKLTQQDLALRLNVSRQTVIAIEKGGYEPSLRLALEISRFFNERVDHIFYFSNKN